MRQRRSFINRDTRGVTLFQDPNPISTPSVIQIDVDCLVVREPFNLSDTTPGQNISIKAPSLTNSYTAILPNTIGTVGQILTTDGTKNLSWEDASSIGDVVGPGSSTDEVLVRFDGITGKIIQGSSIAVSDVGAMVGVASINTVVVESHGLRHLPNGLDALTTAAPLTDLSLLTTNDTGLADSYSRSDHTHALDLTIPTITLPLGYLSGCKLVFNTVSTVDVQAGTARDITNAVDITIGPLTLDVTKAGALGLMTGHLEMDDITYEIHLMHDDTDSNADSAFLVPEGVAPVETGYSHFRYIGAVHNDFVGTGDFVNFYMGGNGRFRTVMYYDSFTTVRVLNNGDALTWELVVSSDSVADFCPVGSTSVILTVDFESDVGTNDNVRFRPEGDTGDHIQIYRVQAGGSQGLSSQSYYQLQVPLGASRDLEYEGTSASLDTDVAVAGYTIEL